MLQQTQAALRAQAQAQQGVQRAQAISRMSPMRQEAVSAAVNNLNSRNAAQAQPQNQFANTRGTKNAFAAAGAQVNTQGAQQYRNAQGQERERFMKQQQVRSPVNRW